MKMFVEKVNIIVEQDLPDGRSRPVIALTLGKYKRVAVEMNVYNWSSEVPYRTQLCIELRKQV